MRFLLIASSAVALVATSTVMYAAEERRQPRRDQMICKSEPKTGSRFGRRICMSESERERLIEDQRRKAGEIVNRPVICVGKEGC